MLATCATSPSEVPADGLTTSDVARLRAEVTLVRYGRNPRLEERILSVRRVGGQLVGVLEIAAPTENARSTMVFGHSEETTGVHSERGFSFLSIADVPLLIFLDVPIR